MEHLCLQVAPAPQPAFDMQHASEVAEYHRIRAAGGDVRAFAVGDVSRDVAILQREGATKPAASLGLVHLLQLDTRQPGEQRAWLGLDAELAQSRARIVIGDGPG